MALKTSGAPDFFVVVSMAYIRRKTHKLSKKKKVTDAVKDTGSMSYKQTNKPPLSSFPSALRHSKPSLDLGLFLQFCLSNNPFTPLPPKGSPILHSQDIPPCSSPVLFPLPKMLSPPTLFNLSPTRAEILCPSLLDPSSWKSAKQPVEADQIFGE